MYNQFVKLILLVLSLFGYSTAFAQVGSPALDPNCYFPIIGAPNEIDTIYGRENNQQLGWRVKNVGPLPGDSYGQIAIGNLYYHPSLDPTYPIVSSGPAFNLHKLEIKDTLKMGGYDWRDTRYIIGRFHFRSQSRYEILYGEPGLQLPRLYLPDANGRCDSIHYIQLVTHFEDSDFFRHSYAASNLFATYLSSDTCEDIICSVVKYDSLGRQKLYLLQFKGGNPNWDTAKFVYPDSVVFIDSLQAPSLVFYRQFTLGDFRGAGKEDIISNDGIGNYFLYRNTSIFSLSNFANSMRQDTLLIKGENPNASRPYNYSNLIMKAFPRISGDLSEDFVQDIFRNYDGQTFHDICIFKGGPQFGSKRLIIDSADFIIHEPKYYDSKFSGIGFDKIYNCGDMAGTGNPVLFVSAGSGIYSAFYFYVLGKAMDDKIDIFFEVDDFASFSSLDTLVADGDGLQDIIMGLPGYYSNEDLDNGKQGVGTIFVVHGSKKIPVHTSAVYSATPEDHIKIFPNPANRELTVEVPVLEAKSLEIVFTDVLGREVFRTGGETSDDGRILINLPPLSSDMYYVKIVGLSSHFVPIPIFITGK